MSYWENLGLGAAVALGLGLGEIGAQQAHHPSSQDSSHPKKSNSSQLERGITWEGEFKRLTFQKIEKNEMKKKERQLTQRQELFAQFYVKTKGHGSKAYELAGYQIENLSRDTISSDACKLKNDPRVATLIEKLQLNMRFRLGVDEESLLEMGKHIMKTASKKGKYSASIAALNELNKMLGGHKPPSFNQGNGEERLYKIVEMPSNDKVKEKNDVE